MKPMSTCQDSEIRKDQTVGDLVLLHPRLRARLEQLGIDYCCGGKQPLMKAAQAAGLEWPTILAALRAELRKGADAADTDWSAASLTTLADHILEKHHTFMREQLPRLDTLLAKVQRAHGAKHGDMLAGLRCVFDAFRLEIEPHLLKEEQVIFPAIKGIEAFMAGTGPQPVVPCGNIAQPIRQLEREHEHAGDALTEMRRLTDGYQLPADACQSFAALYEGLKAMEADLHEHVHLENNILFPKSVKMEGAMTVENEKTT